MSARETRRLFRFWRNEEGSSTIQFVIMVPLLFGIFMTGIELGIYSMRQMWLDRGLDIAVREVRLNTANIPSHQAFKQTICQNAPFLPNCTSNLKLEMIRVDPRNFSSLSADADCIDNSLPVASNEKLRNYQSGQEHDLMMVRACIKFNPVFPSTGLGFKLDKDKSGQASMLAFSAFVQEPGN
ncbi:MAG: TadE/TadG family type IV pilus assembly protein [Pseudomonadota bacterium]